MDNSQARLRYSLMQLRSSSLTREQKHSQWKARQSISCETPFGHLKAIAVDKGGQALLLKANIAPDEGVVDVADKDKFIASAKTRQWDREKSVRTLP